MSGDGASLKELTAEELSLLEETFREVPYARHLGLEFVAAERGAATFAVEAREELTRMGGILHGGAVVSLMDTAAACAVHTLLGPGGRTVTVDLTVHFLRPAGPGRVKARARIIHRGRRVIILNVEAHDGDGVLIATSTMTYYTQG